jgi:osmoprotectant transport system ATP-binding protein
VIELTEVSKSFQGKVVLPPTSLTVAPQASVALIGPSGCGKSTLLRLVIGLIHPDSGTIKVNGNELRPDNLRQVRLGMGSVIQDGGLFPHMTAAQNVTLMARQQGWEASRASQRLAQLADLVQLPQDLLGRYPAQLSGGQRQRVGIMRALMLDPEVLLLDEPMGALDPIVRNQLQKDLRRIFRDLKKTVLFVTHDMAEAAYLGDEITLMRKGIMVQRGPLQGLVSNPADPFVTEFLNAQMYN